MACVFAVSLFGCKITTSEPDTFTVTFDANGGSGTIESITKTENEEFELPANTFTRTGYTFASWNTKQAPDESSKSYKDKEKIKLTEDLTLYAQWEENPSYSINYNLNEGKNPDDAKISYKQDETVVLPVPTRELYDFAGWYLTQDFSDEAITGWNAGERTGDTTLYAKWTVTVKAENLVNIIENLPGGIHNIRVVGEIDETTIMNIGETFRSIQNHSNKKAKVNLDLSKTTGLERIPESAFLQCTSLISIEIPENVTSIGGHAFGGCSSLKNIEIPSSVTSIGIAAFIACSLADIKIPEGVTNIGEGVFYECTDLKSIEIPASLTNIGLGAFYGCRNVTSLYVENDNKVYQAFNNCLYTKDGEVLITVFGNPSTISFLQSITIIDNYAFEHCTNLTTIKIPESVTSIGSYAFDYCINLTNIEIPSTVTSIGDYAFMNCTNLTTIEIPESVTSIDYWAFYDCPNLTTVNYTGTMEQWKKIDINKEKNDSLLAAKIICTDGIINE